MTGSDYVLQDLIPWWVECVRKHNPDTHITIADFGLTDSARDWVKHNVNHVIVYEKHPELAWFLKPQAMLDCPYEYTCWLDLDCEMVAPVPKIFDFPTPIDSANPVTIAEIEEEQIILSFLFITEL